MQIVTTDCNCITVLATSQRVGSGGNKYAGFFRYRGCNDLQIIISHETVGCKISSYLWNQLVHKEYVATVNLIAKLKFPNA